MPAGVSEPAKRVGAGRHILMRLCWATEFASSWSGMKTRQISTTPTCALIMHVIVCPRFSTSAATSWNPALPFSEQISQLVVPVDQSLYGDYERLARERIETRDPDDWPVVAVALMLDLPIWTEDQDLFGSGVPTWTTDRVELYLKAGQAP
jgi:hypothetical protein